jgi:hypothetical protein
VTVPYGKEKRQNNQMLFGFIQNDNYFVIPLGDFSFCAIQDSRKKI